MPTRTAISFCEIPRDLRDAAIFRPSVFSEARASVARGDISKARVFGMIYHFSEVINNDKSFYCAVKPNQQIGDSEC
jgi:uncharacterized Fe-S cluster-containing protein